MIRPWRAKLAHALRKRLGFPLEELSLARLRKAGLRPTLVFDVGASYGPFVDEMWRHWPGATIHCFEPEPEYARILERRADLQRGLKVCRALVGPVPNECQGYNFRLGASSILPDSDDRADENITIRQARMITLDDYSRSQGVAPDFLKIDVQGYELEVLRGSEAVLPSVEVIFTEVNHIQIYRGSPLAAELIGWLAARGFALHDVCNFMRRPSDGALWQTDMIFVRHESPLRASKEW